MGMSVQSSTASAAPAMNNITKMQQEQQSQMMQTLMASTQTAPQEPVSKPVGNTGNNVDIRA